MKINDNIQYLKGIGPLRAQQFKDFGVETVIELIRLFPKKHLDFSTIHQISEIGDEDIVTIAGNITRVSAGKSYHKAERVEAYLHDGTGGVTLLWFNAPFMKDVLLRNGTGVFSGKVSVFQGKKQIVNPSAQFDGEKGTTAGGFLPVYPAIGKFSQNQLRVLIKNCLDECENQIRDPFEEFCDLMDVIDVKRAYRQIHFPESDVHFEEARIRFVMEEFLLFQLAILLYKKKIDLNHNYVPLELNDLIDQRIRNRLPFRLTEAQNSVIYDIREDLKAGLRVNRLVQGDVGSGKTAVAIYFLLMVVANKMQGALIAPTEVLATQHYLNLKRLLKDSKVKIGYLAGSQTKRERATECYAILDGTTNIVIGTHAVFSDKIEFKNLGGVVIDEQHRFGVAQRSKLIEKGKDPHILVMTATPIPRTLSLTLYGDLETSVIDALPPGRSPIRTLLINESERRRAYSTILHELKKGHQAYLVCPLIEESEDLEYQSALSLYESIEHGVFEGYMVGLLHGRMNHQEKQTIMDQFKNNEIHVLVCTQVIEVGVDNPNATIILIDSAERFGLAQLHQLRGRVGRGSSPSICLLLTPKTKGPSFERLRVLVDTNDGFKIAEADLEIRGTGEYFGLRQSGLPEFKVGHPLKDLKYMTKARKLAIKMMQSEDKVKELIRKTEAEYGHKLHWGGVS